MKPIKPVEFIQNTAPQSNPVTLNLAEIGMLHAAPFENERPVFSFKVDLKTGLLFPS